MVPVANTGGYTVTLCRTPCHCQMTLAARVFCPTISAVVANLIPAPFASVPSGRSRLRAITRKSAYRRVVDRLRRGVLRVGELTVDPATRSVRVGGRPVALSAKEFAMLHALASDPGRVVPKGELLRDVWGYASFGVSRTVDAHACRLRKKLSVGERRAYTANDIFRDPSAMYDASTRMSGFAVRTWSSTAGQSGTCAS